LGQEKQGLLLAALRNGEGLRGQWLRPAHGVRCAIQHETFAVFDGAASSRIKFELE